MTSGHRWGAERAQWYGKLVTQAWLVCDVPANTVL